MSEILELFEKILHVKNRFQYPPREGAFKASPLDAHFACVCVDATYTSLTHDPRSKKVVYIAVGICEDGCKEVLTYTNPYSFGQKSSRT